MGVYGEDFYEGEPALTVNQFGKGRAYYLAAKAEPAFYGDFYQKLSQELGLARALKEIPYGVEACLREGAEGSYLFLQNFSGEEKRVELPQASLELRTGVPRKEVLLAGYDAAVLRIASK